MPEISAEIRSLTKKCSCFLSLSQAASNAPAFDKGSVADYSNAILAWWRDNCKTFPAWALAARIVFAISPNSASCERVFALLKNLFLRRGAELVCRGLRAGIADAELQRPFRGLMRLVSVWRRKSE